MSLCLLCPGQGNQSPQAFEQLQDDPLLGPHLHALLQALPQPTLQAITDPQACTLNQHAQPLVVAYGLAAGQALIAQGVQVGMLAGYSVGELTAVALAGHLSAHSALQLASQRAHVMDAASPAGFSLLAVRGLPLNVIEAESKADGLALAIVNDVDHVVLAGPVQQLTHTGQRLKNRHGAHTVSLPVSIPSHSHWLAKAAEPFRHAMQSHAWQPALHTVLSGLDGSPMYTTTQVQHSLQAQLSHTVLWHKAMEMSIDMGATAYFEVGPGCALSRMMRTLRPDVPVRSLAEFSQFEGALEWLRRHV